VRPYLPTHPLRKQTRSLDQTRPGATNFDTFSSSTNPEGTSSDDELTDSDTSDLLSSPDPSNPAPSHLPTLWPSTRQLFPSASQPTTPSISSTLVGHRSSSLLNLTMTPSHDNGVPPSSPELRYKRLFHPPPNTSQTSLPPIDPETQREVEKTIQPLEGNLAPLHHIESNPETQSTRPTPLFNAVSYAGNPTPALDEASPIPLTPAGSPMATKDNSKATSAAPSGLKTRPKFRDRIHGVTLPLDLSGTRGMMLRRKKSSKSLNTMNQ
jgi:TAG lipase/steryl ester hydrolase/phospholipase A2/LPA acyltransferase